MDRGKALTKKELVQEIANETGVAPQDVYAIVQRTFDHIIESLAQGNHVEFRDFGVWEVRQRKARIGRNPNQPEAVVDIPPRKVVKFKPGKKMREEVMNT